MKRIGGVRNHEGYMDLTAYQALKNIERKTKDMEVKRGDIFEIEKPNGERQPALVISSDEACEENDSVCIVYLCKAKYKRPCDVDMAAGDMMVARCEKIYTMNTERLTEYMRTANEREMKEVDRTLLRTLGIEAEKDKKHEDNKGEGTREEGYEKAIELKETHEQLIRAEAERDVYKSLYERITGGN